MLTPINTADLSASLSTLELAAKALAAGDTATLNQIEANYREKTLVGMAYFCDICGTPCSGEIYEADRHCYGECKWCGVDRVMVEEEVLA